MENYEKYNAEWEKIHNLFKMSWPVEVLNMLMSMSVSMPLSACVYQSGYQSIYLYLYKKPGND